MQRDPLNSPESLIAVEQLPVAINKQLTYKTNLKIKAEQTKY